MCRRMPNGTITREHARSTPANKSLRGSRGPEAGVRGIPSPFIKIYERGRDTPHPSLLPLLPRKGFLDEVLATARCAAAAAPPLAARLCGAAPESSDATACAIPCAFRATFAGTGRKIRVHAAAGPAAWP